MSLPEVGDVFALEVAPGVDLLLRVVEAHDASRCVVATRYAGPRLVRVPRSAALFEVQPLTQRAWNRPMLGGWVATEAPPALRLLGYVAVRPVERARVLHPAPWLKIAVKTKALADQVLPLTAWDALLRDAKDQWRWDHARAALLAEDASQERRQFASFAAALNAPGRAQEEVEVLGVAALKKKRFFAAWKGAAPVKVITAAEALLRDAVTTLQGRTSKQATRQLTALVRAFNRLHGQHGHVFDTDAREDIMEAVGTLARACRVDDETFDEIIDAAREF